MALVRSLSRCVKASPSAMLCRWGGASAVAAAPMSTLVRSTNSSAPRARMSVAAATAPSTPRTPLFASEAKASAVQLRRGLATAAPKEKLFDKILIANRGEIAVRIIKTCRKLGIKTVAIYSTADANSLFKEMADEAVCVGPPASTASYLNVDAIVQACKMTGAQAVHPGYGFLSEKTYFAAALAKEGIKFIGPPAKAIDALGDKISSKTLAKNAKVNIIPGFDLITTEDAAVAAARQVGYPVMVKAANGGGGKGMRVAWNDEEARTGFRLSLAEAKSAFNSDRIFVEKFIEEPRHIEIQVLGDSHGNYVYLNERECSVQRRNQKIIEEAPSVFLDDKTRKAMGEQACALARAVGYESAGTCEMLVDKHRNFYFLEMNTRLQVEHPVTEMITGVDLVEQMIRVAAGHKLPFQQKDIGINGWALEARVYAEDPLRNFMPSIGRLNRYVEPTGPEVRCDSGIREGAEISIYYDPMICKLITHAKDRNTALATMREALDNYVIRGVTHNINFLHSLCDHPRFIEGRLTTNFIPEEYPTGYHGQELTVDDKTALVSSSLVLHASILANQLAISGRAASVDSDAAFNKQMQSVVVAMGVEQYAVTVAPVTAAKQGEKQTLKLTIKQIADKKATKPADDGAPADTPKVGPRLEKELNVEVSGAYAKGEQVFVSTVNGVRHVLQVVEARDGSSVYTVQYRGTQFGVDVRSAEEHRLLQFMPEKQSLDTSKFVVSPMPGAVFSVSVAVGDKVVPGQEVCVVEAMKMQNALRAQRAGVVKAVHVAKGKTVAADDVLIEFA